MRWLTNILGLTEVGAGNLNAVIKKYRNALHLKSDLVGSLFILVLCSID
mgnify:CR=1 FL=1